MDDFHKPTLDAIGFQELITEEAAAWNIELTGNYECKYQSLGKQPSWIEYTTDVNETYGEFAAGMPLAFTCLNRVYEEDVDGTIANTSTYIDPTIYNPYRDWETDRKSTRLNSSHSAKSRMPSSA